MNLCWVTLHVRNIEKSLRFYHEYLGLEIFSRFGADTDVEIVMLGTADQPKVELLCGPQADPAPAVPGGITVGFAVPSLDDAARSLAQKGVPLLRGPVSPNPHLRFAFVQDPDGYEVQLAETR